MTQVHGQGRFWTYRQGLGGLVPLSESQRLMAARRERRGGVISGPLAYGLGSSQGAQEVWEGMGVEGKKRRGGRSRKRRGGADGGGRKQR